MEPETEGEPEKSRRNLPPCPLCGGMKYTIHEGRLDSKWGMTSHPMTLLICLNCKFVLHFYEGHSFWDFD
jgi:uncharacterized protein